ncbi:MAG: hypothetical protein ACYTCN_02205 [Planctomycetota bacterium]|jgi:hypothetical protein
MKIDLKNPTVYYIAVPILAGIWAVMAGFVFYPRSLEAWDQGRSDAALVKKQIEELVSRQPQRLTFAAEGGEKPEEFDYTKTINDFAKVFSVSDTNYNLVVRGKAKRSGRQTQSATIAIKSIDIEKLAQFLSALLLRWPDLKCEVLSIEKVKNTKNSWKCNLSLTYYYE